MFREGLRPPDPFGEKDPFDAETQDGMTLRALAKLGRVVLVCLPALDTRLGRAWLGAVADGRAAIEAAGARLVLVHHAPEDDDAAAALARKQLQHLARIADPARALYRAYELGEAPWVRAAGERVADFLKRAPTSNQVPGAFLLVDGETAGSATGRDVPDLAALVA